MSTRFFPKKWMKELQTLWSFVCYFKSDRLLDWIRFEETEIEEMISARRNKTFGEIDRSYYWVIFPVLWLENHSRWEHLLRHVNKMNTERLGKQNIQLITNKRSEKQIRHCKKKKSRPGIDKVEMIWQFMFTTCRTFRLNAKIYRHSPIGFVSGYKFWLIK